jgi:tetratricopeptide (TPR) repeat protein
MTRDDMAESTVTPRPPAPLRPRRINWLKWSLGCAGVGMILFAGITMLILILTPVVFRSLLPEQQARIIRHLPFMDAFQPTHPYKYLPTIAVTNDRAMALLATPTNAPPAAMSGQPADLSAGQDYTLSDPASSAVPTGGVPPSASPVVGPPLYLTATPEPTLEPTPIPSPTLIPVPSSFHDTSFKLVPQDWNNCGPANLTQALQYYGWKGDQHEASAYLKPNREDKNVSPWQMVTFVNDKTGVKALWRVGGEIGLIKRLVSQKFAVILEAGYDVPSQGWMGHYMTITGYDESDGTLTWLDTNAENLNAPGVRERYGDIEKRWAQFNRLYIVVYPETRTPDLAAILGSDADRHYNAQHALGLAREQASKYPGDPFGWFDMGSSYVLLGQYKEAAAVFDEAWRVGNLPFRILWYQFTPYEAYYNVGQYGYVIALTQNATVYVEETFYWRAMAEAALSKTNQAIDDFKRVLAFNRNFSLAADKLALVQNGNFTPPVVAQAQAH